jgi:hypothetical protein
MIARVRLHFHPVVNISVLYMYASERLQNDCDMAIQQSVAYKMIKSAVEMAHMDAVALKNAHVAVAST